MFIFLMLSLLAALTPQEGDTYRFPRYPAGDGTTPNILDLIEGRCFEYLECVPPINSNIECDPDFRFNCTSLVMDFKKDIAYQEPCTLGPDAFEDFVNNTAQEFPPNSHLLWSGTKEISHVYGLFTKRKTLEDSLVGFMMNDVAFCGSVETGFDFRQCPSCQTFSESASGIFWPKASAKFASLASGEVEVVLSASNGGRPSFRNGSIFRSIEVPKLTSSKVSKLTTILVRDLGDNSTTSEHCGAGSLLELKNIMHEKNITFSCEENPNRIRAIQCATNPRAKECIDLFNSDKEPCSSYTAFIVVIVILVVIIIVVFLLSLYYFCVYKHTKDQSAKAKLTVCCNA
ncbi:ADP-ribosyl cyclase/cyclic ADP-ribose hydrolase-like isoform X2 [Antedon mediterranea]|uniref:ADP-ribosyl cyclase/cyclic ADP-ribose hydrolase-like isoform X2 n=1 Tax=Antedon mediterranea TaxID=105859 RepID=UPI003AF82EDA